MKRKVFVFIVLIVLIFPVFVFPRQSSEKSSFTVARLKYGGGGDWYSDPSSLHNLLGFVRENTNIDAASKEVRVEISDEALFSYPYIYMTGHGNIRFSEEEAKKLRKYLTGGGFLHADDNYGMDRAFRREMKRVFPDKEFVELPFSHDIYHCLFEFKNGLPKIHEHDGGPPHGYALFHEGRMIVFYSFNTDLGDGWEDYEVHKDPEERRTAALKMGANIVFWALTH
ncbi:DUF4159 domain-containing protein [candidate division KSB1 bacterium]